MDSKKSGGLPSRMGTCGVSEEGRSMSPMSRRSAVSLASVVGLLAAGCGSPPPAAQQKAQYDGTMAVSTDGKFVYTTNADLGTVTVLDADQRQTVATVQVGQRPARIAVGPDDTLYVTDRGSRAVSIIHRGQWTEAGRIAVGAEPIGIALSNDGATLYVVGSASGTVDAFDVSAPGNAQLWEANLGNEPRGVAVLPDGRLYVTHYRTGMVDVLDGASGNVLHSISAAVGVDASSAGASVSFPSGSPTLPSFRPVGLDSIVVSQDGSRAYLVHSRDRMGVLQGGGSSSTPVVVPALTTLDAVKDSAFDDTAPVSKDFPPPVIFPGPNAQNGSGSSGGGMMSRAPVPVGVDGGFPPPGGGAGGGGSTSYGVSQPPFEAAPWTQGPVAAVLDPAGQFLFVANQNSDDVSVIATRDRTAQGADNAVVAHVPVGFAPSGLAISADGKTLFVHDEFAYSVSIVQAVNGSLTEVARVPVVEQSQLPTGPAIDGRLLFYSATSSAMTVPGAGVACESCHLEGGNDGNV